MADNNLACCVNCLGRRLITELRSLIHHSMSKQITSLWNFKNALFSLFTFTHFYQCFCTKAYSYLHAWLKALYGEIFSTCTTPGAHRPLVFIIMWFTCKGARDNQCFNFQREEDFEVQNKEIFCGKWNEGFCWGSGLSWTQD